MKPKSLIKALKRVFHIFSSEPKYFLKTPSFIYRNLRLGPRFLLSKIKYIASGRNQPRFYNQYFQSTDYLNWSSCCSNQYEFSLLMRDWSVALTDPPVIAVVMPVYNPNPKWLKEAIDSVVNQHYVHWQLCIADDCSTDPEVRKILESASDSDSRISVKYRSTNGHICEASNTALELVTAPWVALLDHDDLLSLMHLRGLHTP